MTAEPNDSAHWHDDAGPREGGMQHYVIAAVIIGAIVTAFGATATVTKALTEQSAKTEALATLESSHYGALGNRIDLVRNRTEQSATQCNGRIDSVITDYKASDTEFRQVLANLVKTLSDLSGDMRELKALIGKQRTDAQKPAMMGGGPTG